MKHRYQKVRAAVIFSCVLAAGICYSCSGKTDGGNSVRLPVLEGTETDGASGSGRDGDDGGAKIKGATAADEGGMMAGEEAAAESGAMAGGEAGEGGTMAGEESAWNGGDMAEGGTLEASVCYVHICGEVVSPGVYEMEEGSRIFQVVERAGGFTEQAAAQYLNMAQEVCDGMKIVVPDSSFLEGEEQFGIEAGENGGAKAGSAGPGIIVPGTKGAAVSGGTAGGEPVKGKVNLNTASKEELMTLKGIGEAKADDIISYRESHGGFTKIEDIMKISGIKNAAFEKIKDDITV